MALELKKELPSGIIASYWKITKISIDYKKNETAIRLGLWVNNETRINNLSEVDYKIINIPHYNTMSSDMRDWGYTILKESPEFKEAIDC